MKNLFFFLCFCIVQTAFISAQDTLLIKEPPNETNQSDFRSLNRSNTDRTTESIMFEYYDDDREVRLNYNNQAFRNSALAGAGTGALIGLGVTECIFFNKENPGLYDGKYTFTHLIGTVVGAAVGVGISYILFL